MVLKLKYFIKLCIYWVLHIFYIFPIKKENVYFVSFGGKHVCCNPKYIYEYMQKQNLQFKYIWCSESRDDIYDKRVIFVKNGTLKNLFYSLVSKYYITNNQIPDYLPFRKSQIIIETWHGGGVYKKDGYGDNDTYKYSVENYLGKRKRNLLYYFISSSSLFTKYAIDDFVLPENKFVSYGMPRNDIFFDSERMTQARKKVRNIYNIADDKIIVMYAPTFRNSSTNAKFDFTLKLNNLKNVIESKFNKKVVFFMRGHHTFLACGINMEHKDVNTEILNVTDYPDMQELICSSDILITDYSSTLWDWSFTYKPAFIYAPDMDYYKKERGFYIPIEDWGFPLAKTNEQLSEIILTFNSDDFISKMHIHQEELGSFEKGNAAQKVVEDILKLRV